MILPPTPAIAALPAIACPTLTLVGALDLPDFHTVAWIIKDRVPNSRYCRLDAVGHLSNMEDPAAFNTAVRDFLNTRTGD